MDSISEEDLRRVKRIKRYEEYQNYLDKLDAGGKESYDLVGEMQGKAVKKL